MDTRISDEATKAFWEHISDEDKGKPVQYTIEQNGELVTIFAIVHGENVLHYYPLAWDTAVFIAMSLLEKANLAAQETIGCGYWEAQGFITRYAGYLQTRFPPGEEDD